MRIAYATRFDPLDVRQWSGISFHMIRALEAAGANVEVIGPLKTRREALSRARRRAARAFGRTVDITREPPVVEGFGRQVDDALRGSRAELLLSPDVPTIAASRDPRPKAMWTGSSLPVLVNYYADYTDLTTRSLRFGREQEASLLTRCAAIIYASDWVRQRTVASYGLDASRVSVVPFGANVVGPPDARTAEATIAARGTDTCNVLFLGVDWVRKRGDLAVAIIREFRASGVNARLTVVGCTPPEKVLQEPWIRATGYLDKATVAGRDRLTSELKAAHFLLHPTTAETFGVALCEAAAFGVPVLATNTGGIPDIVIDGWTGALVPPDAPPTEFSDRLISMSAREIYPRMALASFERWRTHLNWAFAGRTALETLRAASASVTA